MTHALIVDDNRTNVNVLAELLALEGATTTQVYDPAQLDSALAEAPAVDVIFLDLEMPHLTGYEVLEALQAEPRFQDVPVVAYTVHVSEINEARRRGFHSFLGKPLDSEAFSTQFARILQGERVWTIGLNR